MSFRAFDMLPPSMSLQDVLRRGQPGGAPALLGPPISPGPGGGPSMPPVPDPQGGGGSPPIQPVPPITNPPLPPSAPPRPAPPWRPPAGTTDMGYGFGNAGHGLQFDPSYHAVGPPLPPAPGNPPPDFGGGPTQQGGSHAMRVRQAIGYQRPGKY